MDNQLKTLGPLLRTLWNELRKGKGTMLFCQADDQGTLAQALLSRLHGFGEEEKPRFFHYSFPGYNPKPYAPFLDICRDELSEHESGEIAQFLDHHGVYHYHKGVLAEYLSSGTAIRREDLLPEELDYESYRMQRSIWDLLNGLFSDQPLVVVVDNAQFLPKSTLRLLKMVLRSSMNVPFLGIFIAPEIVQSITDAEDSPWNRILEVADQQGLVLNFPGVGRGDHYQSSRTPYRQILDDPQFYDGINAYNMLALDDAETIFRSFIDLQLYHRALPRVRYQVWKFLGLIDLHRGYHDAARRNFENALSIAQQSDEDQQLSEVYQMLGSAYLGLANLPYAQKMAKLARRFAEAAGDESRLFRAHFLSVLIEDHLHPDDVNSVRPSFDTAVELAEKQGLENSYTFLKSMMYGVNRAMEDGSFSTRSYPALTIPRKRDNTRRQANTLHSVGMAFISRGEREKVLANYRKSKRLKLGMLNNDEPATTYNGIGFFHLYDGDYRKSFNNFKAALELLEGGRAYREVAMTLYNLGLLSFLAMKYDDGVYYTDQCLNIMKILKIEDLSFHSRPGIMVLLGLNLLKAGNTVRSWQVRVQVELEQGGLTSSKYEEKFFFRIFQALHQREEGQYHEALQHFQSAEEALLMEPNNTSYLHPLFYLEFGDMYLLLNRRTEAKDLYERCADQASLISNQTYERMARIRLETMIVEPPPRELLLRKSRLDCEWAIQGARMQNNLNNLKKRLEDINQINMLFGIISEEEGESDLIQNVMDLLFSYFELDFEVLLYFSRKRNRYQQRYIREKSPIEKNEQFTALIQHLGEFPDPVRFTQSVDLNRFSPLMDNYGGVLSISVNPRSDTQGLIVFFTRAGESRIRPELLQLFSIVSQQFGLALERLNQKQTIMLQNEELKGKNDLLRKSSTTDYLTNLGNRAALYDTLESEISRYERYNRNGKKHLALLFIDLDNFKFFNDTYGHAAGDALLIQVSRTITTVIRQIDTAFRYGGDEFVVVLPETDEQGAGELGQRIIREIEGNESYRNHLKEILGRSISVPEGKQLSCSIGIAATSRLPEESRDVDGFLNLADKALYQAKMLGKHRYYLA
ncbi:tetratricopeptide repeat-containing diguanylate cyclase [Salinispira pacifica]|nr:tetratricopeptide repeat-containing diguanylate cyclase [Salinispira pacifica]